MFNIKVVQDPGYLPRKEMDSGDNALRQLSKKLETLKKHEQLSLDEICFSCLRHKGVHQEHCSQENRCVQNYQCYSKYFDKCIGINNQRSYFFVIITCLLLFASYLVQIVFLSTQEGGWSETQSERFLLRILEFHWNALFTVHSNWHLTFPLIFTWLAIFSILDLVLLMVVSICRGVTLNEMNKGWGYKFNFEFSDPANKNLEGPCGGSH
jgi:DHHC palmitoyltransferase